MANNVTHATVMTMTKKKLKLHGLHKSFFNGSCLASFMEDNGPKGYPWVDLFETVQLETWRWINVCVCLLVVISFQSGVNEK